MRVEDLDPELLAAHCLEPLPPDMHEDLATALLLSLDGQWDRIAALDAEQTDHACERLLLLELLQDLEVDADVLVELCGRLVGFQRMCNAVTAAAVIAGAVESGGDPQALSWDGVSNTIVRLIEARPARR